MCRRLAEVVATVESVRGIASGREGLVFVLAVTFFLWLTVLFANLVESLTEARGRARSGTRRSARQDVMAPDAIARDVCDPSEYKLRHILSASSVRSEPEPASKVP